MNWLKFLRKVGITIIMLKSFVAFSQEFRLESDAFKHNGLIPQKYTCQGQDISPHLKWSNFPKEAKSFALICDDPDAPGENPWVHWVIYNIPKSVESLKENFPKEESFKDGTLQGVNDFKKIGYGGPCPPEGSVHHYYFKLYALSEAPELRPGLTKDELIQLIGPIIITHAELIGTYQKK